MAETAAHMVDHVFPEVPARQWVLSIPFALRYRLAYDSGLMSKVLNAFVRTVFGELRRRAKELLGLKSSQCGAVTFVQRFNDSLQLAPHYHSLVIDGVYAADGEGRPEFHQLPPPENEEVARVASLVAEKVDSLLKRSGLGPDDEAEDSLSRDEPGLAAIYSSSVRSRIASGPNTGGGLVKLGDHIDGDGLDSAVTPRCATVRGFSVHANVCISPGDRLRLERLVRYVSRPAVSTERLSELPDGRLLYRLKRRWRNGTTEVVFDRSDFIAKLAALVPAPRVHLRTFHGILAPAAKWRPQIIPKPDVLFGPCPHVAPTAPPPPLVLLDQETTKPESSLPRKNYSWSQLLRRVFDIDVSVCERCGGPVRVLAAIQEPETAEKILNYFGLPAKPPPTAPARYQHRSFPDYL